jgi:uncharacterized protein YycO
MLGDALLFKGASIWDRIIDWFTHSQYSHVAIDIGGGWLIEAYPGVGVRQRLIDENDKSMVRFHVKGSSVANYANQLGWLQSQLGKPYDFKGIGGFVLNDANFHNPGAWFCSAIFEVFQARAGYIIVDEIYNLTAPGDIARSVMLERVTKS